MQTLINYGKKLSLLAGKSIFKKVDEQAKKQEEIVYLFGPAGMIVLR